MLLGPATEPKRAEGSFSSPTYIDCRDNGEQGRVPADLELTVSFTGRAVLTQTTSESSVMTRVQSALKEKCRVHWAKRLGGLLEELWLKLKPKGPFRCGGI